jgi:hypothetical protein
MTGGGNGLTAGADAILGASCVRDASVARDAASPLARKRSIA